MGIEKGSRFYQMLCLTSCEGATYFSQSLVNQHLEEIILKKKLIKHIYKVVVN